MHFKYVLNYVSFQFSWSLKSTDFETKSGSDAGQSTHLRMVLPLRTCHDFPPKIMKNHQIDKN